MTLKAVHRAMFVVRKAEDQGLGTAQKRFTQRQGRATAQQCWQRDERAENDAQHEPRMSSEDEAAEDRRWRLGGLPRGARP